MLNLEHDRIVRLLIENDANLEILNKDNDTALAVAIRGGNL